MGVPELLPFADEHLDAAAELLAARHREHCRAAPLLPSRYEEPAEARAEIEALRQADGADGLVAVRDGRVVGYLLGVRKSDEVWGANAWVEPAAHAAESAEDARDLYGAAAAAWVAAGLGAHYAVVPASDAPLVDAWFRAGFGQQQALAIRELPDAAWPDGVRAAEPRDVEALVALAPLLSAHQNAAPVFSGFAWDGDEDALRRELLEELEDGDVGSLVAEVDGRIVSHLFVLPADRSSTHAGLVRPEHAAFIGVAVTHPAARGSGAGLALTQASFAWARGRGYDAIVTDWRVTNLLASRFWPARGFRPTFLRLHRQVR